MRISAIILARGGSKGIINKNLIEFCGAPLLAWTIEQCLATIEISEVWVSSDSSEILSVAKQYGSNVILRPNELAQDSSSSESAWLHALDFIEMKAPDTKIDYLVGPQVTSPIRDSTDFSDAIQQILSEEADSLLSVTRIEDFFMWSLSSTGVPQSLNYDYKCRQLRQNIDPKYLENGSFYIFRPSILRQNNNRIGGKIIFHELSSHKMFQIDNNEDIVLLSAIMKEYKLNEIS